VDVAAFALRIACWSMQNPHSRPVLILDEPFKHLKGIEQNKKVLRMIRKISKRLKLQIIMISDERIPREDIIENADRVFEVSIKNGISHVNQN
jgi:ABC-type sulfate/molybdate transport systems ATPase subunit